MGVKRTVQRGVEKVTSRLKHAGITRSLSNPSTLQSLQSRGVEWIYLILLFLLVAGVINAASNAGTPGINNGIIVPNPTVQNTVETFVLLFSYLLGALGIYGLFLSGRQTIRARSAEMFFVFGLILIGVAMTLGYYVLNSK